MKIKITIFALAFLFAPTCAFADVNKSGTLSSNETWDSSSGVYVITDNFTIPQGVTLTINPGTIVKIMPSGQWSQILFSVQGTLSSIGTPSQNITFTSYKDDIGGDTNGDSSSTSPNAGDWAAIVVNSTGTANFSYSKISYAGQWFSYGLYVADVYNDGGSLSLTNSIISSSASSGVIHAGGALSIVSTTFQDNTIGISAFGSGTVSLTGSTFTNNTKAGTFAFQDGLRLSVSGNTASGTGMNGFGVSGTMVASQTWKADTVPYIITDNFTIPQGVTLTINPGTIVKIMPSDQWSQILFSIQGTLSAIGAPSQNITFTSYKDDIGGDTNGDGTLSAPAPGDWAAIVVNSTGTADFSYSKISYAGHGFSYGPYVADVYNDGGNLSLTNSIISSSASSGITHAGGTLSVASTKFQGNTIGINTFGSSTVSLTGSTFTSNTKAGTFSFQDGLRLSVSGNTASGTGMNGFGVSGIISTSQTWNADTVPYVITDNFTIPQGVTLTINPGTIVKIMPSGPWSQILFTVSGTLSAIGTPSQNITFTSYKDDIGGDTNGDSSATSPNAGDWAAIVVNSTGTADFSYSKISYAGQWFSYGLYVADVYNDGGSLSLTNSIISSSAASGVIHAGGTTNISQSSIHDNGQYGILNGTTVIINAQNNYWGDMSGPYHSVLNPSGLGNAVSDFVTFIPFLTTDPALFPVISAVSASSTATTTASISWTTDILADSQVEYGLTMSYSTSTSITDSGGITSHIRTLTGLMAGTPYHYRVKSRSFSGNLTTSGDYTFTTNSEPETTQPSTPTGLTVTPISSTQINLAWASSTDNVGVIGYKVEMCQGHSCTNYVNIATTTTKFYNDEWLLGKTTYRYRVRAYDAAGNNSGYSTAVSNKTKAFLSAKVVSSNISTNTTWSSGVNVIQTPIVVNAGKKLTIKSGAIIKFNGPNASLTINGTVNVNGTSGSGVIFTSILDDSVGGNTNNDSSSIAPHLRDWQTITVNSGGTANLAYSTIRYAGNGENTAGIQNAGGNLTLANGTITLNPTGIYLGSGTTNLTGNTISNNTTGVYVNGGTVTASLNTFNSPNQTQYAVFNNTAGTVNFADNSWGNVTGPYNPTDNPGGLGNLISDRVRYIQWHDVVHYILNDTSVDVITHEIRWTGTTTPYTTEWNSAVNVWNSGGGSIIIAPSINRVDLTAKVEYRTDDPYYQYTGWWNGADDSLTLNSYVLVNKTPPQIQNTVMHELGHALGIAHSYIGNIMEPYQTSLNSLGGQDRSDYYFKWF
jgi:hypothetical protein